MPDLPAHLTDLYERSIKHLNNEEQKLKLRRLLVEYQDVFARHDLDLGCLMAVKHRIDTKDNASVKHRMR
jgi:hypothetical protein